MAHSTAPPETSPQGAVSASPTIKRTTTPLQTERLWTYADAAQDERVTKASTTDAYSPLGLSREKTGTQIT
jgi:hypothetical protein